MQERVRVVGAEVVVGVPVTARVVLALRLLRRRPFQLLLLVRGRGNLVTKSP
eukprot:SAG22_NODE_14125_length_383_cov_1.450704_1_plen_51_part_01